MESSGADNRKALRWALLGDDDDYRYEMEGLRRRHGEQITIFVKKDTGKCITLKVDLLDTIRTVKAMIGNEDGILIFGGKCFQDDSTLASCGIQKESTLFFRDRLRGGCEYPHPPQVLRGTGSPAQQQKRYSTYSRKVSLFIITMVAAYTISASESVSVVKVALMLGISAVIIADAALSLKKALAPKWPIAWVYHLSVPWSIYLSGFLLVLSSYLVLVSFNKDYGYAIIPVPLPIVAALVHHRQKSRVSQQQQQRTTNDGGEADQAVDTESANEDVLRGENNGETDADHNSDDEADVEHFDDIFETSCNFVTCGGLVTMFLGRRMVGPVSPVGFFIFYTVVLGLYTMTITTVRTVALTPHATYLEIIMKVLAGMTTITYLFEGVRQ